MNRKLVIVKLNGIYMTILIINDGIISFIVPDPMGMDKFISEVRVLN